MSNFYRQSNLFNDAFCERQCFARATCGGGYETAPCGCAWKKVSKRKKCKECYLVCLQRTVAATNSRRADDAFQQYLDGLPLPKLRLTRSTNEVFPVFIPTRTSDFPAGYGTLPLRWAAVDAKQLLRERVLSAASLEPSFDNPTNARHFLRVPGECRLLSVMNAQDRILESFWAMDDRIGQFQKLGACGFEVSTGATFSVMHLTTDGTPVPRFHNHVMQQRHHRVASEIQQAGLLSVPNLYWQDEREWRAWAEWLARNSTVSTVSRDLTRTRRGLPFREKMDGLLSLLDRANRPFHVFLVGTGPANAAAALYRLATHGHSGTVITSDPILKGVKGRVYDKHFKSILDLSVERHEAVLHNIELFENHLLNSIDDFNLVRKPSRNLLLALTE